MHTKIPEKIDQKKDRTGFIGGLLGLKVTYFLLFGSYGAVWPYLALYFRQNGLSAGYVGIIAGIRPMIQFISCPFWAIIADRYKASRSILNMSMIFYLIMTALLFLPRPTIVECPESLAKNLSAASSLDSPYFHNKTALLPIEDVGGKKEFISKIKTFILNSPEIHHVSESNNLKVHETEANQTIKKRSLSSSLVHEPSKFPVFLYKQVDLINMFWILFVLTVVGEFFEAPGVALLDTSILQCLENINNYGRIRLWGSLGFGFSSFIVGFTLDHVHKTICNKVVTDFFIIVYFFLAWTVATIIVCWVSVKFKYEKAQEASFSETMKVFKSPKYALFLLTCFYLGFAHGSIMNFINWYLEDLGANRVMMGTATILRDFSVVFGFYISPRILETFGIKFILLWVFFVYIFSYFSYSIILTPWMAVPVEALQGLAFSIMWAASIHHLAIVSNPSNFATMQGIIQGVYWGLGTGTGAVIGGLCIQNFGSKHSFRFGGYITVLATFVFFIAYLLTERYSKTKN